MKITDQSQINFQNKYYVVESKSGYKGDKFTICGIFTTKEEALEEKKAHTNRNPSNLRKWTTARYRHRKLLSHSDQYYVSEIPNWVGRSVNPHRYPGFKLE
jgi:hypothetical protein